MALFTKKFSTKRAVLIFLMILSLCLQFTNISANDTDNNFEQFIKKVSITDANNVPLSEYKTPVEKNNRIIVKYEFAIPSEKAKTINDGDVYTMTLPKEIKVLKQMSTELIVDSSGETLQSNDLLKASASAQSVKDDIETVIQQSNNFQSTSKNDLSKHEKLELKKRNTPEILNEVSNDSKKSDVVKQENTVVEVEKDTSDQTTLQDNTEESKSKQNNTISEGDNPEKNDVKVKEEKAVSDEGVNNNQEEKKQIEATSEIKEESEASNIKDASDEKDINSIDNNENFEIKENIPEVEEAIEETQEIKNSLKSENKSLGRITFYTDNTIKIVFSDYAKNHPINVRGSFTLTSYFDEDELIGGGNKEIDFLINDSTYPIIINFKGEGPTVEKSGNYDKNTNEITWTITVDTKGTPAKGLSISDKLNEQHEFVQNFDKDNGNCEVDNNIDYGIYTKDTRTFSYDIPDNFNGVKVIKFKTMPVESIISTQGDKNIENTVDLRKDNEIIQNAKAIVPIKINYIYKKGTLINDNKSIQWEISINPNRYLLNQPTIVDELPSNLILDKSSVMLFEENVENAALLKEGTDYTLDNNNKFEYKFKDSINKAYTLKLKTDLKDDISSGKNLNISNTAKLLVNNNVYLGEVKNIEVPKGISKSGRYIAQENAIEWSIVVNENKTSMEEPVITDDIVGEQDYITDSISIIDSNAKEVNKDEYEVSFVEASESENVDKTGTLIISFNNKITDKYTIKFKTKPREKAYKNPIGTWQKFNNECSLKVGNNDSISCKSNTVSADLRTFDKTYVDYNPSTNDITWKLTINKYKVNLKGKITVKEIISSNQKFVKGENSLLDNVELFKNGNKVEDISSELACREEDNNIIFDFINTNENTEINDFYEINLKTKIIDFSNMSKHISYRNEAELNCDNITLSDYEDKLFDNVSFITKSADNYEPGDSFINWSVAIKFGSIQKNALIKDAVIKDILAEGLSLSSVDSIKFYEVTELGEIPLVLDYNPENGIKYTNDTRELIIPLPELSTEKEYLLKFRTEIVNKDMDSVENTVSFNGKGYTLDSSTKVIGLKNQEIIGSGSGEIVGSIKIIKKDSINHDINLEGAEFELYKDNNFEKPIARLFSDVNGEVCFNNLEKGLYVVKEVNPPNEYLISKDCEEFEITDNNKDIEYLWYNQKDEPKYIRIIKIDASNPELVIKDAKFGLYDSEDKLIESKKTDADGIVTFDNLENGVYKVKELEAPQGYSISEETREFVITDDTDDIECEWPNSTLKSIRIIKIKENRPNTLLKGAEFGLYNSDKKFIESKETDEDGCAIFENLENGSYIVKELRSPSGYRKNRDEIVITLDDNSNKVESVIVENERSSSSGHHHNDSDKDKDEDSIKGSIKVIKVDDENKVLKGAEFGLYDLKGILIESRISNEEGIAEFNDIKLGSYVLKEIKGIEGYKMNVLPMNITLNSSVQKSITIKNEKENTLKPEDFYIVPSKNTNKGNIKVVKINSNNEVLSGAEIGLYNSNGMLVNSKISDSNGVVIFNDISLGNYFIKEIKAPIGYSLSDERINVTLDSTNMITYNLLNIKNDGTASGSENNNPSEPISNLRNGNIIEKIKPSNVVKGVKNSIRTRLPQSGSFLDNKVLITIGLLLICTGVALFLKKKCKGWK